MPTAEGFRFWGDASRTALADLALDARANGRGDRPVWALYLQALRGSQACRLSRHPARTGLGTPRKLAIGWTFLDCAR